MLRVPAFRQTVFFSICSVALISGLVLMKRAREIRAEHDRHQFFTTWSSVLPPGSPFPPVEIEISGSKVAVAASLVGHWTFVFYSSSASRRSPAYHAVLLGHYEMRGLRILHILPPGRFFSAVANELKSSASGIDVGFDWNRSLGDRLRTPGREEFAWSFLVDPNGIIRFSMPSDLSPENMRQLAERHLVGQVSFTPAPSPGYAQGAAVPDVPLLRIRDSQPQRLRNLARTDAAIIFFRANCTQCSTKTLVFELTKLQQAGLDRPNVVVVFSHAFEAPALKYEIAAALVRQWDVYLAGEYVPVWEDPYLTVYQPPKVITVDEGKVSGAMDYYKWFLQQADPGMKAAPNAKSYIEGWPNFDYAGHTFQGTKLETYGWFERAVNLAITPSGDLYVLDGAAHRIEKFDAKGARTKELGGIGQAAGDFFHPSAMALDAGGNLYVMESGNMRVQTLRPDGSSISQFQINTLSNSIAANSRGEVLLNAPRTGHLVTVYSRSGEVLRSFGDLVSPSRVLSGKADSRETRTAMSRALLLVDADDSTYAVFQFMPLVQKFSGAGKLLWERRLESPPVKGLVKSFSGEPGAPQILAKASIDGIQLPVFSGAACLDSRRNTWIAVANYSLVVLSPEGQEISWWVMLPPKGGQWSGIACSASGVHLTDGRVIRRAEGVVLGSH